MDYIDVGSGVDAGRDYMLKNDLVVVDFVDRKIGMIRGGEGEAVVGSYYCYSSRRRIVAGTCMVVGLMLS